MVYIVVQPNESIDSALKRFNLKLQQSGLLRELKAAGRIRYLGITSSSDRQYQEMEAIMRREALDFIQVDYAVGNRGAGERLLPLAAERGMAVMVNLPFGRGAQFRDDCPEKKAEFGNRNTVISKGPNGEMQFRWEPIPEMPAELKAIIEEMK